jgi:hypothetical protein
MIEFKEHNGRVYMIIIDAKLLSMPFRNFEGRTSEYNATGEKEFGVVIEDSELAQQMAADNWTVKTITNRDGKDYLYGIKVDGEDLHWVKIKVKYRDNKGNPTIPPKVLIRTANNEIEYEEDDLRSLDTADLMDVDLRINIRRKTANGKTYTTGYLNTMKATLLDDSFWFGTRQAQNPNEPPFTM